MNVRKWLVMEKLSRQIQRSKDPLSSLEMIDYVISIQLEKIEKYNKDSINKKITENSESAMENMIELLKLRSSVANKISFYK